MRNEIRLLPGQDVHLRIWLDGIAFDYKATATAAQNFIRDWERKRWHTIELIRDSSESRRLLSRLPNERLFLGPDAASQARHAEPEHISES